jgi:hypothetical protein
VASGSGRDKSAAFDALVRISHEQGVAGMPAIDPAAAAYIGDATAPRTFDRALAGRAGAAIDVGDALPEAAGPPLVPLHHGYQRTVDAIATATAAMREHGVASLPDLAPEVVETTVWTFERPRFPAGRRLRVRVRGGGFVHAGVRNAEGAWDPVYNVPLVPVAEGGHEAVLPPGVDAFTFFWTEAPWAPGHPGHWERGRDGRAVFEASRQ